MDVRSAVFTVVVSVGLCSAGCVDNKATKPTQPTQVALGDYSGSVKNTFQGSGIMTMSLTQSGSALEGTWQTAWPGGGGGNGSLRGSVSGTAVTLTLEPLTPMACPSYTATAILDGPNLSGAYTSPDCPRAIAGDLVAVRTRYADFDLVKQ